MRTILIYIIVLFFFACLKAKKSPFDVSKPTGAVGQFIIAQATNSRPTGNTNANSNSSTSTSTQVKISGLANTMLEGSTMVLAISLSNQPTANITLSVSTSPSGQLNANLNSFTFTNSNYSVAQTLNLTAPEDDSDTLDANITLTLQSTETGTQTYSIKILDNDRRIFVTNSTYNGNLGGIAGADTKCQSDANKPVSPSGQIFKALIVDSIADLRSPPNASNVDWVLKSNTYYRRVDSTIIFLTNASGLFSFGSLTNAWSASITALAWTGVNTDWTPNANQCINTGSWLNNASGVNGNYGTLNPATTSSQAISGGTSACNSLNYLICVEQ
jgi:hypothetical protein